MNQNLTISRAVRMTLFLGAGVASVAPAVFAQEVSQGNYNSSSSQNQATTGTQQLGKIEVTGTRILRTSVETAQPITIITEKQIQDSGLTTIGDVLTTLTQSVATLNRTIGISRVQAESQVNLRYFGPNRVLVLVNGQRWTENIDGTVDINSIPSAVIDHVEILQDGASAIYGSDAIAGVINIITKKNYNGAEANAYLGVYNTDESGFHHTDGKRQSYSFTMGASEKRVGATLNVSYVQDDPVWCQNRIECNSTSPFNERSQRPGAWSARGHYIITDPGVPSIGQATPNSSGEFNMTH